MPKICAALPLINENELLPRLAGILSRQTFRDFTLFACVNQPDEWWNDPLRAEICRENTISLKFLTEIRDFRVVVIDRSTPGSGWKGRDHGVGWARKTIMDEIAGVASDDDLIVSLDADATFSDRYFESLAESFSRFPTAMGMAVPYFHKPVEDERAYRAILRYEIYMRHYSLNLWRIGSPYTFTALGSAMACPVKAYKRVGGMTPKMSGEDFYFLQKLRKAGRLLFWNSEKVYPEARFSDRVCFGTGPAMIRGDRGDWSSYPVYRLSLFDEIGRFYRQLPLFYPETGPSPVVDFLRNIFREEDPLEPLRRNSGSCDQFIRACHERFDGLRILQYLKGRQKEEMMTDEECLLEFLTATYPGSIRDHGIDENNFSFRDSDPEILENIRHFLARKEEEFQVSSVLS